MANPRTNARNKKRTADEPPANGEESEANSDKSLTIDLKWVLAFGVSGVFLLLLCGCGGIGLYIFKPKHVEIQPDEIAFNKQPDKEVAKIVKEQPKGSVKEQKENVEEIPKKAKSPQNDDPKVKPKNQPRNFTNSIGMKFAWIPPGTFIMGSPENELQRDANETQHKVTLTKGFYMGVYTVTQVQWQVIMENNPSKFRGEWNLPVENVSWHDCQEFITKLRRSDKELYRLPTEAEWEYACRAGTTTPFHFGETISTDQANYFGKAIYGNGKKGVSRQRTTPVGSFPPNALGLCDMHGNVFQWCQDFSGDYPQKDVIDPQELKEGNERALRGGSWGYNPQNCRSAFRSKLDPTHRNLFTGFRLCCFVD